MTTCNAKEVQPLRMFKTTVQALRYRVHLDVTRFNGQVGAGIYLLDLDHAGAKLETPFPLSPQYPIEFSFCFPGTKTETTVTGRVVWTRQLTAPIGKYHLGVQFYGTRWDLEAQLHNI
jgi:hypothetical protein